MGIEEDRVVTIKARLEARRENLIEQLENIDLALDALDKIPELEKALDTIGKAFAL